MANKSKQVNFRLTAKAHRDLTKLAKYHEMAIGEVLRELIHILISEHKRKGKIK